MRCGEFSFKPSSAGFAQTSQGLTTLSLAPTLSYVVFPVPCSCSLMPSASPPQSCADVDAIGHEYACTERLVYTVSEQKQVNAANVTPALHTDETRQNSLVESGRAV